MVQNGCHLAARCAACVDHVKTEKVAVIKLVIRKGGQGRARGKQTGAAKAICRFFCHDPNNPRGKATFDRTGDFKIKAAVAFFRKQRGVSADIFGIGAKTFEAHFTAHAKGACNRTDTNQVLIAHSTGPSLRHN